MCSNRVDCVFSSSGPAANWLLHLRGNDAHLLADHLLQLLDLHPDGLFVLLGGPLLFFEPLGVDSQLVVRGRPLLGALSAAGDARVECLHASEREELFEVKTVKSLLQHPVHVFELLEVGCLLVVATALFLVNQELHHLYFFGYALVSEHVQFLFETQRKPERKSVLARIIGFSDELGVDLIVNVFINVLIDSYVWIICTLVVDGLTLNCFVHKNDQSFVRHAVHHDVEERAHHGNVILLAHSLDLH